MGGRLVFYQGNKVLVLAISILFFAANGKAQQKVGWYLSAQIGYGKANLNDLYSTYTPYFEGYAKLPMSLPGYENPVLFVDLYPSIGNASIPFTLESGRFINDRFSFSLRYTFYKMLQNGIYYFIEAII